MSFNVRYDEPADELTWSTRLPAIAAMFEEHQPDVIGVQEALVHQVEDLAAALEGYEWVGVGRVDGDSSGEFTPIFFRSDRFEVLHEGTFWLSETPETPSTGWDASTQRIATWAELAGRGDGARLLVINTHFDHEGGLARSEASRLVAQRIEEIFPAGPVVLTGDLNAIALDPSLDPLFRVLDDARTEAPVSDLIGSVNGWRTTYGLYNIDYILVRGGRPARFETINDGYGIDYLSDHFPILATLHFEVGGS